MDKVGEVSQSATKVRSVSGWQCGARRGWAGIGLARHGNEWQARHGEERLGMATNGRQGPTRLGEANHGVEWHGHERQAWRSTARPGWA